MPSSLNQSSQSRPQSVKSRRLRNHDQTRAEDTRDEANRRRRSCATARIFWSAGLPMQVAMARSDCARLPLRAVETAKEAELWGDKVCGSGWALARRLVCAIRRTSAAFCWRWWADGWLAGWTASWMDGWLDRWLAGGWERSGCVHRGQDTSNGSWGKHGVGIYCNAGRYRAARRAIDSYNTPGSGVAIGCAGGGYDVGI
jgi:hypothetical protein